MINHVYTLLRNRDGIGGAIEHGAYVQADYRAVPLSPAARRVHSILFGVDADETSVAIRLRQYTALLHSTQLAAAVLAFDPRVTYLDAAASPIAFGLTVTNEVGDAPLFVVGEAPEPTASRSRYLWRATVVNEITGDRVPVGSPALAGFRGKLSPSLAGFGYPPARILRIESLAKDRAQRVTFVSVSAGLTGRARLVSTDLMIRFHDALADPGDSWLIEYVVPPSPGPGGVLATLDSVAADAVLSLFGTRPSGDYASWKRMWQASLPLPYRLGAVLLALASRIEETRTGVANGVGS